jgi:ABC-2 type transport system ATP-binding protein
MLKIENVSKTYSAGKVKALDNVCLEIKKGEIFGFLGPNGAGKTTTIKILTGILKPDIGQCLADGHDIQKSPIDAKKTIGYVNDNPELFAKLKAREYLNFVADVYGIPTQTRQEVILKYATKFEIDSVLNSPIGGYSHGMKQKLLVTASLIHDPSNWILDEPMTGLDPKAAFLLKDEMRKRADTGKTVFFSTHIMEVAEKICDRIAIINKGKILFTGTLDELQGFRGSESSLEDLFLSLTGTPETEA